MKRKLLLIAFFIGLFLMNNSQAQNYNSAIGGKLGYGLIASYKNSSMTMQPLISLVV
ncbi:MAG: hypothetical protein IPG79_12005 [Saprospiraceae bacterium]|nr:hypothetical protein [Saprospiraceae bacterium]MBK8080709.1 hypothetical protein [Saprospiraceae bacterium]